MEEKRRWIERGDVMGEYRKDEKNSSKSMVLISLLPHIHMLSRKTEYVCIEI